MFDSYVTLSNYTFRRPFYERKGWDWFKDGNTVVLIFNTLGIDKKDISVSTKPTKDSSVEILQVKGKTMHEDLQYEMDVDFNVFVPIADENKNVEVHVKDGFTRVIIPLREPAKSQTKIEMVD